MGHIYRVTHNNGKFCRKPLEVLASKPSMAAKHFLDGRETTAPVVKLRKGEFITISIERLS